MIPQETERRDDDRLVVGIFVAAPNGEEKRTRLLKVIRDHRTNSVELILPERTEVVSVGWVPEITYESTEGGYSLNAVIRLDFAPVVQPQDSIRQIADESPELTPSQPDPQQLTIPSPTSAVPPPAANQLLYEVTFRNREIAVNGFRLSRPNFNSENEVVFEHVFRNANRRIDLAEIESVLGRPLTKKLREVIRDLGFTGDLRDLFFPGVSKNAIEFVNPVTTRDFEARGLRSPQLEIRTERKREKP